MKNLFKEAHKMAREIKAQYLDVNYSFQFSLCLKYLQSVKEEVKMVELQGSEKQVAWAEQIRTRNIDYLTSTMTELKNRNHSEIFGTHIEKLEAAISQAKNIPSAKAWIEKQHVAEEYIRMIYKA
jgi:hypothetical protein